MPGKFSSFLNKKGGKSKLADHDLFGVPVKLNINGDETIGSPWGAVVSLIIIVLSIGYALDQFVIVYTRSNSTVADIKEDYFFDSSEKFDLKKMKMYFAFTVQQWATSEYLDDTDYVLWEAGFWSFDSDKHAPEFKQVDIHRCTQSDFDNFYPFANGQEKLIQPLIDEGRLNCLDWDQYDEFIIQGDFSTPIFNLLVIKLVPCHMGPNADSCQYSQQETFDYLKQPLIRIVYNNEAFDFHAYGEKKVKKTSQLYTKQFVPGHPVFEPIQIQKNVIEDQDGWLQIFSQEKDTNITQLVMMNEQASQVNNWYGKYKFISFDFEIDLTRYIHRRQVYGLFDMLSQAGGLNDILMSFGSILVTWLNLKFAKHWVNIKLFKIWNGHYVRNRVQKYAVEHSAQGQALVDDRSLKDNILLDLKNRQKILDNNVTDYFDFWRCCCTLNNKQRQMNKEMRKAHDRGYQILQQELDIVNLIKAQRRFSSKLNCLINAKQRWFCEHLLADEQLINADKLDDEESSSSNESVDKSSQLFTGQILPNQRNQLNKQRNFLAKWFHTTEMKHDSNQIITTILNDQNPVSVNFVKQYLERDKERLQQLLRNNKKILHSTNHRLFNNQNVFKNRFQLSENSPQMTHERFDSRVELQNQEVSRPKGRNTPDGMSPLRIQGQNQPQLIFNQNTSTQKYKKVTTRRRNDLNPSQTIGFQSPQIHTLQTTTKNQQQNTVTPSESSSRSNQLRSIQSGD